MPDRMARTDVLLVSIGGTAGLRAADGALAGALRRAGASVAVARVASHARGAHVRAHRPRVGAARRGRPRARRSATRRRARSSTPRAPRRCCGRSRGAIRFDAPAAGNRPGRHGLWQRPVERRRFAAAPLLLPWSEGALAEAPSPRAAALVVPVPVAASGPPAAARDLAAITYGANPHKKGTDRVLAAWRAARRPGETLVVAGPGGRRRGRDPLRGHDRAGRVPRAAAPRPRVRHRARAARTSASRSSRRSPTARSSSPPPRPARTPRSRSPARSTRGSSATTSPRRSAPRSTTRRRATPSARPRPSRRGRPRRSTRSSPSACSRPSSTGRCRLSRA